MKLPQVIAQVGSSGQYPQPEASLSAGAAQTRALAVTGQAVTQSATDFNAVYGRAQKELREADANAQYDQAVSNLKQKFADYDVSLKEQGVDPDQYPEQVGRGLYDMATEETAQLKYPEAKAKFQRHLTQFATEKINAAKYDGLKIKNERVKALWELNNQQDANTAVFGATVEERQAALARGMARADEGLRRGMYTGGESAAKLRGFLGQVQRGQIRKDFMDPAMQPTVLRALIGGDYEYIPPAEAFTMAQTLQNNLDAQDRKAREEAERARLRAVDELESRARTQTLPLAELEEQRKNGVAIGEDYRRLYERVTKPKDTPSDPSVLMALSTRAHRTVPTVTVEELNRAHEAYNAGRPGLSYTDRKDLVDKVIARQDHARAEGRAIRGEGRAIASEARSRAMQEHAQAEQLLDRALGLSSPNDVLDREDQKLQDLGLQTLTARSSAFPGGNESPLAVAREIIEQVAPERLARTKAKASTVATTLTYKTPEALEQALASGAIRGQAYDLERAKILSINRIRTRALDQGLQDPWPKWDFGYKAKAPAAAPGAQMPKPSEPPPSIPGRR